MCNILGKFYSKYILKSNAIGTNLIPIAIFRQQQNLSQYKITQI